MIKADINSGCKLSHEIVLEIDLDDLMKHGIVVSNLAEMVARELGEPEEFVEKMKEVIDLPITFWDERLSTVMAERQLIAADVSRKKRKDVIDKMAAVVILQGYLDRLQFSKS